MIAYASRTGTRRNLRALADNDWRLLVSAAGRLSTEGFRYGLDNGAWSAFQAGKPFDEPQFEKALRRLGDRADWVVLPDVVAAGERSLELSLKWMRRVLDSCERALLAVQNGMTPQMVRDLVGPRVGIFVGGDTKWKLGTMRDWGRLGAERQAWVHVGRVNTARRIRSCAFAGATSFDGTSVTRYAETLPELERARQRWSSYAQSQRELPW